MSKPTDEAAAVSSPRHVLPKDLPNAIRHLGDAELDRLFAAALAKMRRRGRRPPTDKLPKQELDALDVPLTRGQLNAVRAAFKAGITPTRIARQFGLSQSNVRKALASEAFGPRGTD
jgi:DNA invertase Pin-like site-specific DNA recombinase